MPAIQAANFWIENECAGNAFDLVGDFAVRLENVGAGGCGEGVGRLRFRIARASVVFPTPFFPTIANSP